MRVEDLGGSKSLELVNLVFDKLSKGEKVISLAIGEPLQDTDKEIIDYATKAMFEGYTHYVPTPGIPEFRKSAAEKVNRKNSIKADVENVIFVPSKFAIYSALTAIGMNSSMEVLVPDPGYFYEEPVMLSGMKPVRYKLNADFSLNINEISSKINKSTRALIINDPGNPTGRIFKESELKMVYDLCLKHNIFIISDEAYEDIIFTGTHKSIGSYEIKPELVISIFTLSKTFAMTGWRAGYLVASPKIIKNLIKYLENTVTCFPPFIQLASAFALRNTDRLVRPLLEDFRKNRRIIIEELSGFNGIDFIEPEGAFYVFPSYRLKIKSTVFANNLLNTKSIAVLPGVAFGETGETHFRISYSGKTDDIINGIKGIKEFLTSNQ